MRKGILILLWSLAAWGEPRWLPVGPEQQRDGRFFFEWGSLRQLPGAVWEKEAETPPDRWHYVTIRGKRVWHLFLLPPGVADPASTREWFQQLVPESNDYQLVYSQVPHGGSYWMPFTAPDWQGTLVIAHTIPATLAWLDMGPSPTPPEFKEWLKTYQRSDQLLRFVPGRKPSTSPTPSPLPAARPQPRNGQEKLHKLGSALTFWPLFLLIPMALRARKERKRASYRRQMAVLLAFPPALGLLLLVLGDGLTRQWFPDPAQRLPAFNYLAYRAFGFALLGPIAVLLVRRFRPRRRRLKHQERR
ncbi:MAG: hypothetical protein KF760_01115 [Candidatus Eremiobacteraeota bacterium]|nr:hypothetical protein [Candidatus Eremiobacteraeota bacterium]MCW5868075.1 hypothetical protein [Candidatus Eremiobacteraeota bacterium]